jgi:radical SAM protein with 4Fe4S-binding SPASM domain
MRYRHERFGAIVASDEPAVLAHIDTELCGELGIAPSPLWQEPPRELLSAPTEAHLMVTRRCPLSCSHCYTSSSPDAGEDLSTSELERRIDALAERKVFHLAMGGGEAFLRPDLIHLARYARARGVTPSLTTMGGLLTEELARRCAGVFGQVNLSYDGVSEGHRRPFGEDKSSLAEVAVMRLREAGVRVGFNVVVTRQSYEELSAIADAAARFQVVDMELLRFKPAGRGRDDYLAHRLTEEQRRGLFPKVLELTARTGVPIKLDCSSAPFIACHEPSVERMARFDVVGCIGGVSLLGANERGEISACSFYPSEGRDLLELGEAWDDPGSFREFRSYVEEAPEPCRSCAYLTVCRGGCRAVARFLTGDVTAPDPECPRVLAAARLEC